VRTGRLARVASIADLQVRSVLGPSLMAATTRLPARPDGLGQGAEDHPVAQPLQLPEQGRALSGPPNR
jgi:hypothetical protein